MQEPDFAISKPMANADEDCVDNDNGAICQMEVEEEQVEMVEQVENEEEDEDEDAIVETSSSGKTISITIN